MDDTRLKITAFERQGPTEPTLFRAPPRRPWMDRSHDRFAYRCLPLVMANQAGWLVRNPIDFTAMWNGGSKAADIQVVIPDGQVGFAGLPASGVVESHFGEGILTFQLPYLFRTPEGYNLWVKGPVNLFKDGIQAVEGLVETDWSHAPFTMNWKFTRAFHTIRFRVGEPICQVLPYPRGLIERFDPEVRPIEDDAELATAYARWWTERGTFLKERLVPGTEARRREWQKEYFQGRQAEGGRFDAHQTALATKEFVRVGEV